jgi:hypothetical protein
MKTTLFVSIALICFAAPLSLLAQTAEISTYAGYIWPGSFSGIGDFQNNQLLGVRGGFYVTPRFEIGGNWNWNNHFQPTNTNVSAGVAREFGFPQGSSRANVWEAEFTYNFTKHSLFGSKAKPYVIVGAGGLTTSIKNQNTFVLNVRPNVLFAANDVLSNGDTFFTISYGGGFKMTRLWGPMGVFGDFRGRTLPNFFGNAETWPELSAGLNFAWGER